MNPHANHARYDCPTWCEADHADTDHPDDRWHATSPVEIPALFAVRARDDGPGRWVIETGDLSISTARHLGTAEIVTSIGRDGELAALHLTPESARRLVDGLARHLVTIRDN